MDTLVYNQKQGIGVKYAYLDPVDVVVAEPFIAFVCRVIDSKTESDVSQNTRLCKASPSSGNKLSISAQVSSSHRAGVA